MKPLDLIYRDMHDMRELLEKEEEIKRLRIDGYRAYEALYQDRQLAALQRQMETHPFLLGGQLANQSCRSSPFRAFFDIFNWNLGR